MPDASSVNPAKPEVREFKKWKFSFFSIENNSMSTSFGKKLITQKVTTKMSKLVNNVCLWWKKLNFYFFHFPIFWYCLSTPNSAFQILSLKMPERESVSLLVVARRACYSWEFSRCIIFLTMSLFWLGIVQIFSVIVVVWQLQVLVWLGIFWLFSVMNISGKR